MYGIIKETRERISPKTCTLSSNENLTSGHPKSISTIQNVEPGAANLRSKFQLDPTVQSPGISKTRLLGLGEMCSRKSVCSLLSLFVLYFHPLSTVRSISTMPIRAIAVGRHDELTRPDTLKAGLAEFISTLIFVFAGSGSGMAFSKLTSDGDATPAGLVAAAIAHAFALFVAVSVGANISGGHVNPAVTFGAFVGGNITLLRGIVYVIAQLLGSTVACLLLKFVTNYMAVGAFTLSAGVGVTNALVFEIIMTFGLVYTVYATAIDPKNGSLGTIAPIAIGFIVGANILAGGAFTGASMNPAVSFGPALVSWSWANHWVYWVGPLIGGGLAGLIYDFLFINQTHDHLPSSA